MFKKHQKRLCFQIIFIKKSPKYLVINSIEMYNYSFYINFLNTCSFDHHVVAKCLICEIKEKKMLI